MTAPDAFAALEHILAGDWDRFLIRLQAAIRQRLATDEYKATLVAGPPRPNSEQARLHMDCLPQFCMVADAGVGTPEECPARTGVWP